MKPDPLFNRSGVQLVCFDMDGTILDSIPTLTRNAIEVLQTYGLPQVEAHDLYIKTLGKPFRGQLEEIFPGDTRNDAASKSYDMKHVAALPQMKTAPLLFQLLQYLQNTMGCKTALVTSTHRNIAIGIPALNNKKFDFVTAFEDGFPKERQVEAAIHEFKLYPADTLLVGDTEYDAQVALSLGCKFKLTTIKELFHDVVMAVRDVEGIR